MALNPAVKQGSLNDPTQRANELNDPQFKNEQGYFPYDLTHQTFLTPNFGNITPTLHLDTVPGDRTVVHDNTKLVLNRINGNFLSNMNQYIDSFYVPMRSVFPMNYEKLITNPTKGDDLPNSALPQFPLGAFVMNYLKDYQSGIRFIDVSDDLDEEYYIYDILDAFNNGMAGDLPNQVVGYYLSRLTLLATVFSRGQLLDYLDLGLDLVENDDVYISKFQDTIDRYFQALYACRDEYLINGNLGSDTIEVSSDYYSAGGGKQYKATTLSEWRQAISDILERGEIIYLPVDFGRETEETEDLLTATKDLITMFETVFGAGEIAEDAEFIKDIDDEGNPFRNGQFINIGKVLAYQQIVAHYFTNDSIDNIFNSDLYMQLLRSVMYPSVDGLTKEPTFDYNGVPTEYDYISVGGTYYSLISPLIEGHINRQYIWMTLMMLLRRSLRYGDYFSTARPNLLATGQLGVNVQSGQVSPIDITKNLLMQRYLNACNYEGSGFLQQMSGNFGVTPSDTGTFPRFISHRKIEIQNNITNNTADNQGAQTTNLVAFSDENAFDIFIDDFGYILSVTTFDTLPVYTTGIDNSFHFSDRFDLFNPMLQGIGDQPIRSSELLGNPNLYDDSFGYTMRNSEYKYKLSKAHGAFVNNDLAGFMFKYPISMMNNEVGNTWTLKINPEYIRDKSQYLDNVIPENTGCSPAQYFQFIISCTNEVKSARKIQATPPVLF